MSILRSIGRSIASFFLAALAAAAVFGLLLGLAWMPLTGRNTTYMLVTTLLVAGIAFTLGGYVAGRVARVHTLRAGLAFGLLFGLISCGYILGPHWSLLLAVPLATLLGAAGGRLARRPTSVP
ncbi:MAG TPA: hypothetical protein VLC95_01185 [Anaerolineae bacterium]|nr:hypothetical protein [Anaerolineae bacterium]